MNAINKMPTLNTPPSLETIDLSGLRDIHTLSEPPFFPPAIGWWIVIGTIIGSLIIYAFWYRFYYRSSKQYALRIVRRITLGQLPTVMIGKEIGKLLKRVALVQFPREEVASLSGAAWAQFLYEKGGGTLSREQATFIAESAYISTEKTVAIDEKRLYTATREWIKLVYKKGRHGNKRTRHIRNNSRN